MIFQQSLTLFVEDTPASLSVLPGSKEAQKITAISGQKCSGLLRNASHTGLFARMLLATSSWDSTRCYLTWKQKVTPGKRLLFQLAPSTPRTGEIGSGLSPTPNTMDPETMRLWPTPVHHECRLGYQNRSNGKKGTQKSLTTEVIDHAGGRSQTTGQLNPTWIEWLMGYPTGWTE